ncbi:Ca-binding nodulation protein NodO [Mesorhizobium plurifarium]|uniref:Ca-binding nodulation protein NodO n=1 Tax=Mesorhizobium plurifarium TaxID=69974 RepID=A0A090EUG8_MESPL|nr:Ca-binding nodulation protein NodO [Mesorhizobium plurifarium]
MVINGGPSDNNAMGGGGDDLVIDPTGNDWLDGGGGNDFISAGEGNDRAFGGLGNDSVFGEEGNDYLYGDDGPNRPSPAGQDNDKLYGGPGDDVLFAGNGGDLLFGGEGSDTFVFQSHNPTPGAVVEGASETYAAIVDFDPGQDTLAFDAKGYYADGLGANFVSHTSSRPGHPVDMFYAGAASGANGEHVVVITDRSFTDGGGAANAISGEHAGDIIAYFNDTTRTVHLGFVTAENKVDEFGQLIGPHSPADLGGLHLSAEDFAFV